jgi:peptidoglycan/LPS O-acetylase OafA/YrhL
MDSTDIVRAKMPEIDSLRGLAILLVVSRGLVGWE